MPKSAKEKALAEVSRAQSKFERTRSQLSQDGQGRRESFERAQSAGVNRPGFLGDPFHWELSSAM